MSYFLILFGLSIVFSQHPWAALSGCDSFLANQERIPEKRGERVDEFRRLIKEIPSRLSAFPELVMVDGDFEGAVYVYYFSKENTEEVRDKFIRVLEKVKTEKYTIHLKIAPPRHVPMYSIVTFTLTKKQFLAYKAQGQSFFNLIFGDELIRSDGAAQCQGTVSPGHFSCDGWGGFCAWLSPEDVYRLRLRLGKVLKGMKLNAVPAVDLPQNVVSPYELTDHDKRMISKWMELPADWMSK